jgi:hypothetical protein
MNVGIWRKLRGEGWIKIFSSGKDGCPRRKLVGLSGKLAKRCSFDSKNDMEALCHLAYWLYIYGETDTVLRI